MAGANKFSGVKNIKSRFDSFIKSVGKFFKKLGYNSDYDLWKEMHSNEIGKCSSAVEQKRKAIDYFKNFVKTEKKSHIKGRLLTPSMLYMFHYDNPKHKTTLDFFDTQPLVIMLHKKVTSFGIREVGINLHLLPMNVRKAVMYKIYTIYKIDYNKAVKNGVSTSFEMNYKKIYSLTKALGVGFAVRMYIPELRKMCVEFPLDQWEKAIWIPSKGYAKITSIELEKEWRKYVNKMKKSGTQRLASSDSHL